MHEFQDFASQLLHFADIEKHNKKVLEMPPKMPVKIQMKYAEYPEWYSKNGKYIGTKQENAVDNEKSPTRPLEAINKGVGDAKSKKESVYMQEMYGVSREKIIPSSSSEEEEESEQESNCETDENDRKYGYLSEETESSIDSGIRRAAEEYVRRYKELGDYTDLDKEIAKADNEKSKGTSNIDSMSEVEEEENIGEIVETEKKEKGETQTVSEKQIAIQPDKRIDEVDEVDEVDEPDQPDEAILTLKGDTRLKTETLPTLEAGGAKIDSTYGTKQGKSELEKNMADINGSKTLIGAHLKADMLNRSVGQIEGEDEESQGSGSEDGDIHSSSDNLSGFTTDSDVSIGTKLNINRKQARAKRNKARETPQKSKRTTREKRRETQFSAALDSKSMRTLVPKTSTTSGVAVHQIRVAENEGRQIREEVAPAEIVVKQRVEKRPIGPRQPALSNLATLLRNNSMVIKEGKPIIENNVKIDEKMDFGSAAATISGANGANYGENVFSMRASKVQVAEHEKNGDGANYLYEVGSQTAIHDANSAKEFIKNEIQRANSSNLGQPSSAMQTQRRKELPKPPPRRNQYQQQAVQSHPIRQHSIHQPFIQPQTIQQHSMQPQPISGNGGHLQQPYQHTQSTFAPPAPFGPPGYNNNTVNSTNTNGVGYVQNGGVGYTQRRPFVGNSRPHSMYSNQGPIHNSIRASAMGYYGENGGTVGSGSAVGSQVGSVVDGYGRFNGNENTNGISRTSTVNNRMARGYGTNRTIAPQMPGPSQPMIYQGKHNPVEAHGLASQMQVQSSVSTPMSTPMSVPATMTVPTPIPVTGMTVGSAFPEPRAPVRAGSSLGRPMLPPRPQSAMEMRGGVGNASEMIRMTAADDGEGISAIPKTISGINTGDVECEWCDFRSQGDQSSGESAEQSDTDRK
ncbi:hypothetical protein AX774_g6122 [Zancudomyces culisetae]|uniref:Uncharacterized protein n=2 Tax=Zancudomyces culisetae TaxID=1213189 RepID=A0A1R1PHQ1_ZANCU|nr:hypothetical protein AX774_g6122 [Zancudomyces culisetae]|eukprot:OMH80443.1 hypothetical protein AX774_g6122 [Zancudomyces culisetae]